MAEKVLKDTSRVIVNFFTERDRIVIKMRLKPVSDTLMTQLVDEMQATKTQIILPLTEKLQKGASTEVSQLAQKLDDHLRVYLNTLNEESAVKQFFTYSSAVLSASQGELLLDTKVAPESVKQLLSSF